MSVLVSVGLPVRNAERRLEATVRSVLAQDHSDLELVISDNASTDGTEEVCRELARTDGRIAYHRQPENVGILDNFVATMQHASGAFFRWIGDDDSLDPRCISRSLELFAADQRLVLVTSQVAYSVADEVIETAPYRGAALSSDDPVDRLAELLRLLNESYLLLDPLYGLMRRATITGIPRRNMLREDHVFAAKLALAGPWGHVPEVLVHRARRGGGQAELPRKLGVPAWHARVRVALECRELLRCLRAADLDGSQHRRARAEVARFYLRARRRLLVRHTRWLARRARRLVRARPAGSAPTGRADPGSGAMIK